MTIEEDRESLMAKIAADPNSVGYMNSWEFKLAVPQKSSHWFGIPFSGGKTASRYLKAVAISKSENEPMILMSTANIQARAYPLILDFFFHTATGNRREKPAPQTIFRRNTGPANVAEAPRNLPVI